MGLHVYLMFSIWLFTSIYGGILIYRTSLPQLERIQRSMSIQPDMVLHLARKERLIQIGAVLATAFWCALLAMTCWAITSDTPAACRLYLC